MKLLDLTFRTPEENLACDEALLDRCDAGDGTEVLRFWEPAQYFVVVGYSNQIEREVNLEACRERGISILRRCSGGGTVLQGPGCLNYSLILRIDSNPALQTVTGTNRFVMERNRAALEKLLSDRSRCEEAPSSHSALRTPHSALSVRGHTDLAISDRKFSGNAQRRKRQAVLFHGSFLLNFNLDLVSRLLPMPPKAPDYRHSRSHGEFLMNLNVSASEVKSALNEVWSAIDELRDISKHAIRQLAAQKYSTNEWNFKR